MVVASYVGEVTEEPLAQLLVVEDDGMHRLVFGAYLRGMMPWMAKKNLKGVQASY